MGWTVGLLECGDREKGMYCEACGPLQLTPMIREPVHCSAARCTGDGPAHHWGLGGVAVCGSRLGNAGRIKAQTDNSKGQLQPVAMGGGEAPVAVREGLVRYLGTRMESLSVCLLRFGRRASAGRRPYRLADPAQAKRRHLVNDRAVFHICSSRRSALPCMIHKRVS